MVTVRWIKACICTKMPFPSAFCLLFVEFFVLVDGWKVLNPFYSLSSVHIFVCCMFWYSRLLLDTLKMNWRVCLMPSISGLMKVSQYGELFPPGVKCSGHEVEQSPSPIPEVKNACRHTFTPLYAFMACRTTTFLSVWFWLRQFVGD